MIKELLYSSPESTITYHSPPKGSKKLVITFDPYGCDLSEKGFGSDFVLTCGFEHIFVSHKKNSHYQGLSLEDFYDAVKDKIKDKKVFTYGCSLGGYCAAYYAGIINAQAICISPRNSAHPSIVESDPHFHKLFSGVRYKHNIELAPPFSELQPIVIYDPKQRIDKTFLESLILSKYPGTKIIEAPFASHQVAEALLEVGQLKEFFLSSVYGSEPDIDINHNNSSYYNWESGYSYAAEGDFESALTSFVKANYIRPSDEKILKIISILRKSKKHTQVDKEIFNKIVEEVEASSYFSEEFYLARYQDIAADPFYKSHPALHYILFGVYEGRNPSKRFDSKYYIDSNPDISQSVINPFLHFIRHGQKEGRKPLP